MNWALDFSHFTLLFICHHCFKVSTNRRALESLETMKLPFVKLGVVNISMNKLSVNSTCDCQRLFTEGCVAMAMLL